jgi:hypothetical protein
LKRTLRKIVEKEIERSNATVAGDDKIGSRVSRRFAGSARYPANPSGITQFLGRGEGLIPKIWMCCFYHTSYTINFVTTTKCTAFGVIEHAIFVPELGYGGATTHGVIFAKYVAQITKQQGRYGVGHGVLRFRSQAASHPPRLNPENRLWVAHPLAFGVAKSAVFNS